MKTEEKLAWVIQVAEDALAPFNACSELGPDGIVLRSYWHCHGCNGEYVSTWPKWEDGMAFPHEEGCKYLEVMNP